VIQYNLLLRFNSGATAHFDHFDPPHLEVSTKVPKITFPLTSSCNNFQLPAYRAARFSPSSYRRIPSKLSSAHSRNWDKRFAYQQFSYSSIQRSLSLTSAPQPLCRCSDDHGYLYPLLALSFEKSTRSSFFSESKL
jgi:hypothetical protein